MPNFCYSFCFPFLLRKNFCQILIRLRLNTRQLAAGMIGLRLRLRPDMKARRTAPKLVRAKAG